jgi:hypothetical protein
VRRLWRSATLRSVAVLGRSGLGAGVGWLVRATVGFYLTARHLRLPGAPQAVTP